MQVYGRSSLVRIACIARSMHCNALSFTPLRLTWCSRKHRDSSSPLRMCPAPLLTMQTAVCRLPTGL